MEVVRRYGWKPDIPVHRECRLKFNLGELYKLPPKVSLVDVMPPVRHQLILGSCTAKAIGALIQHRELNDENHHRLLSPSSLFIYYNTRKLEKTTDYDSGASLRATIQAVQEFGVCDNNDWPYDPERFKDKPPARCYEHAKPFQGLQAHKVEQRLGDLQACLANGDPVAFGFTVYESFESPITAATGIVNLPGPGEKVLGGHAVILVGYDDATARFTVRNHYGPGWGIGGYFTMPYNFVTNRDLCDDFWCLPPYGELSVPQEGI